MNRMRRLFFALWPDEQVRRHIQCADYTRLKPNTTPAVNWHITLVFLGPTSAEQQARLEQAAATVNAPPFSLTLDVTGQFKRAQVVWLGCDRIPVELVQLQESLETTLRLACPGHPALLSEASPYQPHLTLYRHIRKAYAAERIQPVCWPVEAFCLLESRPSERPAYRVLNRWVLSTNHATRR